MVYVKSMKTNILLYYVIHFVKLHFKINLTLANMYY